MIFSVWLVSTWFLVDRVALIATSGCFWFALDVLTLIALVSLFCYSSIQLVVFRHLSLLLGLVSCLADLLLILNASGFSGCPIVLFFALC